MSWSFAVDAHPASEIVSAIEHAEPPLHLSEGQLEQVELAKEVAKTFIASGAVGNYDAESDGPERFGMTLSGHRADGTDVGSTCAINIYQAQSLQEASS